MKQGTSSRLRKRMEELQLSERRVAIICKVNTATVREWLSGEVSPTIADLGRFCKHTGTDLQWLVFGR